MWRWSEKVRSSPVAPPSSVKDIKNDYESDDEDDDDDDFVGCDDHYDQYHNEYDSDHCGSD